MKDRTFLNRPYSSTEDASSAVSIATPDWSSTLKTFSLPDGKPVADSPWSLASFGAVLSEFSKFSNVAQFGEVGSEFRSVASQSVDAGSIAPYESLEENDFHMKEILIGDKSKGFEVV